MTKYAIVNFNSGEFSPKIDARADTEKYAGGCRILENMIPSIFGGAEKRPGTEFIVFSLGLTNMFSYIVSYQNDAVCYENDVVVTKEVSNTPTFVCYENSVVCYGNKPVTTSFSVLARYIVCYENSMVFYENSIVTLGV